MSKQVLMFYDLETTGLNVKQNSIHQISGAFQVDGGKLEHFNIKVAPHPKAKIEPQALKVSGVTEEQIRNYQEMGKGFNEFEKLLSKYIDPYDRTSKITLIGFKNASFDDTFLRAWFSHNKNELFGAYFWSNSIDVSCLATQYLLARRHLMPSFKLRRVAKTLGFTVDDSRLHDAEYDTKLMYGIYMIVTGQDIE